MTDLSALVSARLCHDLISPMGAIGNGIELMQLGQPAASPELDLVAGSLGSALARLRFYRLAFGPAEAQARLSRDEARAVSEGMFPGRFAVAWEAAPAELPRPVVKLAFLALLCLEKSLPMGGAVRLAVTADEAVDLAVEGCRVAPPAELWDLVVSGAEPAALRPDGIQFALLRQALDAERRAAQIAFSDSGARIRVSPPG